MTAVAARVGSSLVAQLESALPAMLADLEALVTCESPSADLVSVRASAAVVAQQGEPALGVAPEVVDIDGCRHLRWRLGAGPARVLVLCHHDTVWPIGTLTRLPWSVHDGIARGPGCFDMLAGRVQGFHAFAALQAAGRSLDGVTVLVTGDEEVVYALADKVALGSAGGVLELLERGVFRIGDAPTNGR